MCGCVGCTHERSEQLLIGLGCIFTAGAPPRVRSDIQSGQWRAAPINHPTRTDKGEGPAVSLIGWRDTIIWVSIVCVCVCQWQREGKTPAGRE